MGYEGVRVYLRLFEDAVRHSSLICAPILIVGCTQSVPGVDTPSGAIIRSLIHDVIHLYEINRKECAKILLDLPHWFSSNTFAPKDKTTDSSEWILENLIVEVSLGVFLRQSILTSSRAVHHFFHLCPSVAQSSARLLFLSPHRTLRHFSSDGRSRAWKVCSKALRWPRCFAE